MQRPGGLRALKQSVARIAKGLRSTVTRRPASNDPYLTMISTHREFDARQFVNFIIRFAGIDKRTPMDAFRTAVEEELQGLRAQCITALQAHSVKALADADTALRILQSAVRRFPLAELRVLSENATAAPEVRATLAEYIQRYEQFGKRLNWLLKGTPRDEVARLDPLKDSDQIFHAVYQHFRVEARILDLVTISRVAVTSAVSLFFISTREAEVNPLGRFYGTYGLAANLFEWGADSVRGRAAVARINSIHGRYYIPNDGMKYVLLQTAFTWLDGIDLIGHRPLGEVERRGFFNAYVGMGLAMHIEDISYDYDEMYAWYKAFNRANAYFEPIKKQMFEMLVANSSIRSVDIYGVRQALLTVASAAIDDDYRTAIGYSAPDPETLRIVRSCFHALGTLAESMPMTTQVRSMQNTPVYKGGASPSSLGVNERSKHLPVVDKDATNGGYPTRQAPIRTAADIRSLALPPITWEEVQRHRSLDDLWVVLDGEIYDLTGWAKDHPGGTKILLAWAGRDATDAFHRAKHSAATKVFRLNYRVGRVVGPAPAKEMPNAGTNPSAQQVT
jgi:cytochrome b involved in lipid metabolism